LSLVWIEPLAVINALLAVGLGVMGKRITWLFWVSSSLLYGWIFAQARLWADSALQLVFLAAAVWGWQSWGRSDFCPGFMSLAQRSMALLCAVVLWSALSAVLLATGGSAPLADAFVGANSLVAQVLMVRQRTEHWLFWLAANLAGVGLFWSQELKATAALYLLFAAMALSGFWRWSRKVNPSDEPS